MKTLENLNLSNSFAKLGADFLQEKLPDPVSKPYLIDSNPSAIKLIGLKPTEIKRNEFLEYFSGNRLLSNSKPLAMVYSGHQFGSYNPRLGDGRGLLLGEVQDKDNNTLDIHLKGCGPTRFSRGFDGRATLRASIREYLGGEAVHGLGIPTTRSLAVIGTGELVHREVPEPGAILVRLTDSHVRFGSFQFLHFNNKAEKVTALLNYIIERHYPTIQNDSDKYRILLRHVVNRTAKLIALWQANGFIHGVMNTDNMTITGATFDYGPFGFMDHFNPNFTPNHSDPNGRYAYGKQPEIGYWNLSKFAETLKHLVDSQFIAEELTNYQPTYNDYYRKLMGQKLGLEIFDSEFKELVNKLFQLLYNNSIDYSIFFRHLSDMPRNFPKTLKQKFKDPQALDSWLSMYVRLIEREDPSLNTRTGKMNSINPKFILRNYLLQDATDKALKESDFSEVERLRILLEDPYKDRPELFSKYGIESEHYAAETPPSSIEMQLSCSA
ncbi:MAG: YdiU family protein [Nitrospinaceae bacterium]|nr:YdiU family protein [Nitrospinaceae bacterium]